MKYSYIFTLRLIYIHFDHQRCLVYLKTISLIIGYIRIALSILPILIDSLSTTLPISYICVYIHTHMNIHICILSIHLCIMTYVFLFLYTCIWLYCRSYIHIYMYICICIYMYIHIYIHTFIYWYFMNALSMPNIVMSSGVLPAIFCSKSCMSTNSSPRFHLNEVVPSGALPAICCMTSEACPRTSPHAHFADCEPLCSPPNELSTGSHTAGSNFARAPKCIVE